MKRQSGLLAITALAYVLVVCGGFNFASANPAQRTARVGDPTGSSSPHTKIPAKKPETRPVQTDTNEFNAALKIDPGMSKLDFYRAKEISRIASKKPYSIKINMTELITKRKDGKSFEQSLQSLHLSLSDDDIKAIVKKADDKVASRLQ